MRTYRLFDEDATNTTFTARVLECSPCDGRYAVVLDRTVFFPEGGGQAADTGVFSFLKETVRVLDVQEEDGVITHYCDGSMPVWQEVTGTIDWDQRFARMQAHTGEHIVSGLVHSLYGLDNIGFHLGDDDVTCDYNGDLTDEQLREVERRANAAVVADLPIEVSFPDAATLETLDYRSKLDLTSNVRIVTIPGVDVCACCAPHLDRTGKVGLIKIVGSEKAHGGTRLHLRSGFQALSDYQEKQENILRIIDLTSARQFETADAVEKLYQQIADLQHALSQAQVRQGELAADAVEKTDGNAVAVLADAEPDVLRALANGGKLRCGGVFVALTNAGVNESDGYRYMITSGKEGLKLSALAKTFNEALNGRGGGKDDMIQGAFSADLATIRNYFTNNTF